MPAAPPRGPLWKVSAVLLVLVLAGLAVLLLRKPSGSDPPVGPAAPPAMAVTTASSGFNGTDIAWAQLMIAMNERAYPMLDLAGSRSSTPALSLLAGQIAARHRAEVARLRELLRQAAMPESNPHEGHDMPGMATAAQLDAMAGASGSAFERLFRASLGAHLEQSISLARSEQAAGQFPGVTDLASTVERDRSAELAELRGTVAS